MCAQLYGIDDPGMNEEDFLDMLEEFGRDCERWRFLTPLNIDENYGFKISDAPTIIIDSCDSLSGWNYSASAIAPTLDTNAKREGLASINLGKSSGTVDAIYDKDVTIFDGTVKEVLVWVYIKDVTQLAVSGTAIRISVYDYTGVSGYSRDYTQTQIANGWNSLGGFLLEDFVADGAPDITRLKNIKITLYTTNPTDTIPLGDIKMDYWRAEGTAKGYSIDRQTLIIIPITERDAKLIEAGFANIGDFKIFAPHSYDIKSHDFVYDPIKNMYLELEEVRSIPTVQITGICKIFIGKVTNRPVPP